MSQSTERRNARRAKQHRCRNISDDIMLCAMIVEHGHQQLHDNAPQAGQAIEGHGTGLNTLDALLAEFEVKS